MLPHLMPINWMFLLFCFFSLFFFTVFFFNSVFFNFFKGESKKMLKVSGLNFPW